MNCLIKIFVLLVILFLGGDLEGQVDVDVIIASTGSKSDVGIPNDSVGLMYNFSVSPEGNWWAGEFELDQALDSFHLRGQGVSHTDVIWVEEQQAPGGLPGTFGAVPDDRQTSINDLGQVAGLARFRDQGMNLGEFVYRYDDTGIEVVAATGQGIPALPGVAYGSTFFSPNSSSNGSVAFVADNITGTGISTTNDSVSLFSNANSLGQQKGVTSYSGNTLQRFDNDRFHMNSTGSKFIFTGDTTGDVGSDDLVVMGDMGTIGSVVLQENFTEITTSLGIELFDVATHVQFGQDDDWYVAGDTVGGTGVVIKNGDVLASEGDLSPDGFAYTGDPIAFATDQHGNYAWAWETSNPDLEQNMLLVYNGSTIVLREGDHIIYDTDSDGSAEEVRMDRLFLDFTELSLAGGHLYLMTEIDDPATTTFAGYAFLRVSVSSVPEPSSLAMIALLLSTTLFSRRSRGGECL